MNLESVRAYCLSLPGATEGLQWGDDLLFRVGNKIFASVPLSGVPQTLTLKSTPQRCAELLEIEGITRAAYVGRYDFITLERLDLLPDAEMKALIAESYENVRSKLPAKIREGLGKRAVTNTRSGKAHVSQRRTRISKKNPSRKPA